MRYFLESVVELRSVFGFVRTSTRADSCIFKCLEVAIWSGRFSGTDFVHLSKSEFRNMLIVFKKLLNSCANFCVVFWSYELVLENALFKSVVSWKTVLLCHLLLNETLRIFDNWCNSLICLSFRLPLICWSCELLKKVVKVWSLALIVNFAAFYTQHIWML